MDLSRSCICGRFLDKRNFNNRFLGYVLSREALRRFVTEGLAKKEKVVENKTISSMLCRANDGGSEDYEISRCMAMLGIPAGDSRLVS